MTMTSGWEASLRLGYVHDNSRTVLKEKSHSGPLVRVCKGDCGKL